MKHSPPHPTNPTPTKATIYQYTAIALVALIHLLDDHPRHIRHRETHGNDDPPKHSARRPSTSETAGRSSVRERYRPPTSPLRPRRSETLRYDVGGGGAVPSRAQASLAWGRIRGGTPSK